MKTLKIFATMLAVVCMMFVAATPVSAQSKKELQAQVAKANTEAKKSATEAEKAKKANEKMAKELAEIKNQLEEIKAVSVEQPELKQEQPALEKPQPDPNGQPITLNFTMADLMRNPDSITRLLTITTKAKKKADQAMQEYADLLAGKTPAKPNPYAGLKGHPIWDLKNKTVTYVKSDSAFMADSVTIPTGFKEIVKRR